jgi:hypothetical protein
MPRANADPNGGPEEKIRPDELPPTEQVRQGTTGHGVRYVLTFGLIFVVVAFLIAWLIIRWLEFGGANT